MYEHLENKENKEKKKKKKRLLTKRWRNYKYLFQLLVKLIDIANVLCIYVHCTSKLYNVHSIHWTYTVCCTMYMYCVVCAVLDFSSNNVGIFRSGRVLFLSDTVLKTAYTSGLVVYSFCLTLYWKLRTLPTLRSNGWEQSSLVHSVIVLQV